VDNANAVKPFGTIETPSQGGQAFGSNYINFGWALTPLPNTIPIDGSTITVWVDGVSVGHPVYNQYRADVAALFPNYNNSNGAVGYFYLDTTVYENGVHTIQWTAADDAGNTDGIGSRYFAIRNTEDSSRMAVLSDRCLVLSEEISRIPPDAYAPIRIKIGNNENQNIDLETIYADESGIIHIEIKELERIEMHLSNDRVVVEERFIKNAPTRRYRGHLLSGNSLKSLPIGSTFDSMRGVFSFEESAAGHLTRKDIQVTITPKFPGFRNQY
jgi:hypothetical protein